MRQQFAGGMLTKEIGIFPIDRWPDRACSKTTTAVWAYISQYISNTAFTEGAFKAADSCFKRSWW